MRIPSITAILIAVFLTSTASSQSIDQASKAYFEEDYITAIKILKPLAEQGNEEARSLLTDAYIEGIAEFQDPTEALQWIAANKDDEAGYGVQKLAYTLRPNQNAAALKMFEPLARAGDAGAQYIVGVIIFGGFGVLQDYAQAVEWLTKSADQNLLISQIGLGRMYRDGTGVKQDYSAAAKWYKAAAMQGDPEGQWQLADMFLRGLGVSQDIEESSRLYALAAEQDSLRALDLGNMYRDGKLFAKDQEMADRWYDKWAAVNTFSAWELGDKYRDGDGVSKDKAEALKWYTRAAKSDSRYASYLGDIYFDGDRFDQNFVEAAKWYEEAAERGSARAQDRLGTMYARGFGVPKDLVEAHKWFNLAVANNTYSDATRSRDNIATYLTNEEITEAQRRARAWLKAHPQ